MSGSDLIYALTDHSVQGSTSQRIINPEIKLSKRPRDQIAYVSVGKVAFKCVMTVQYILANPVMEKRELKK